MTREAVATECVQGKHLRDERGDVFRTTLDRLKAGFLEKTGRHLPAHTVNDLVRASGVEAVDRGFVLAGAYREGVDLWFTAYSDGTAGHYYERLPLGPDQDCTVLAEVEPAGPGGVVETLTFTGKVSLDWEAGLWVDGVLVARHRGDPRGWLSVGPDGGKRWFRGLRFRP